MLCSTLMFSRGAPDLAAKGLGRGRSGLVRVKPFAEHPYLRALGLQLGGLDLRSNAGGLDHLRLQRLHAPAQLSQWLHHFGTPVVHQGCCILPRLLAQADSTGQRTFPEKLQHHIQPLLILTLQKLGRIGAVGKALSDFLPDLFRVHGFEMCCVAGKRLKRSV